ARENGVILRTLIVRPIIEDLSPATLRDLHARSIGLWKTVIDAMRQFIQIRRTAMRLVIALIACREPIQMLATDDKLHANIGKQLRRPRPGCDDQLRRREGALIRDHANASRLLLPRLSRNAKP